MRFFALVAAAFALSVTEETQPELELLEEDNQDLEDPQAVELEEEPEEQEEEEEPEDDEELEEEPEQEEEAVQTNFDPYKVGGNAFVQTKASTQEMYYRRRR